MSGPLTVGEMARHFERAQSVVTEMVDTLETRGLLARMRDERDRRRTLVWLTDNARSLLERGQQVLDFDRVVAAVTAMRSDEQKALATGLRAFVHAAERLQPKPTRTKKESS
jgi:DNA-binding MarR family transcriptional regulator